MFFDIDIEKNLLDHLLYQSLVSFWRQSVHHYPGINMSAHVFPPLPTDRVRSHLSVDDLLDLCRLLAGARMSGDFEPADRARFRLVGLLPAADAYHLLGLLHDLVASIDAHCGNDFAWYPSGARWCSEDEAWLVAHALAALRDGGTAAEIRPLPASYCPTGARSCGLHTATGDACPGGCPFARS